MKKKNIKRNFEDRTHRKVTRSNDRQERKANRHHAKEYLHDLAKGNLDKTAIYDMIDELDDADWS